MGETNILTIISDGWHMILAFIGVVVGYTKLHLGVRQNAKDNRETREMLTKGDAENKANMQEMEERINKRRAEDLEEMRDVMKEVRRDIKTLLQRH